MWVSFASLLGGSTARGRGGPSFAQAAFVSRSARRQRNNDKRASDESARATSDDDDDSYLLFVSALGKEWRERVRRCSRTEASTRSGP